MSVYLYISIYLYTLSSVYTHLKYTTVHDFKRCFLNLVSVYKSYWCNTFWLADPSSGLENKMHRYSLILSELKSTWPQACMAWNSAKMQCNMAYQPLSVQENPLTETTPWAPYSTRTPLSRQPDRPCKGLKTNGMMEMDKTACAVAECHDTGWTRLADGCGD